MSTPHRWYWYVERPQELFVDIDCADAAADTSMVRSHKLFFAERRIQAARTLYRSKKGETGYGLPILEYAIYPSATPRHYHIMIVCDKERAPCAVQKIGWRHRLMDDSYRLQQDAQRYVRYVAGSLLISPEEHRDWWRAPDAVCDCAGKHTAEVMRACPVAQQLRGTEAAEDYMGHPTPPPKDAPPLRFGVQP